MPGFRGNRNHRGNHRRGRGNFSNMRSNPENETEWQKSVRENRDAVDIEFADYSGEKKHELPQCFLDLLNADKTSAKDNDFLLEPSFGITEYVTKNKGFSAILKHRFSDFVVHEIDKNGQKVQLTDVSIPKSASQKPPDEFPDFQSLSAEDKKLFSALLWTRLIHLAKQCVKQNENQGATEHAEVRLEVTNKTKEERKVYHTSIKRLFPHLETTTVPGEGKTFVVVAPRKTKVSTNIEDQWPRDRPKHLNFVLCKEGMEGTAIFGHLARDLGIHNSKFKVAGTKDRRAISTQKVAVSFVKAERLKKAVNSIRGRVFVGNFSYERESLELGDLQGNHFTIVLRDIQVPEDQVNQSLTGLKEKGFINYFGQQRFGTNSTVKTSDIGLALIKKKWEEAVELILKPRGNESPQMTRMRAHWWMYRNPADAVVLLGSRISQSKSIEATLLNGMARQHGNDYVGALSFLQKNIQLLYLHSYQALIWNKAVSKRIEKFGDKVLIGDLVMIPEENVEKSEEDQDEAKKWEQKEKRIATVTPENLSQFSIADVVMPIPGYRVTTPSNEELMKIYTELLEADGLTNGFESLRNSIDLYSLPGDYRYLLVKPSDVSWEFVRYEDANKDILVSDFALLNGEKHAESIDGAEHSALILKLTLPSSSYATMALREAMKIDMGKGNQTKLTEKLNEALAQKRKLDEQASLDETKKAKVEEENNGLSDAVAV